MYYFRVLNSSGLIHTFYSKNESNIQKTHHFYNRFICSDIEWLEEVEAHSLLDLKPESSSECFEGR